MEAPQDYAMDEAYGNGEEQEQQFNQTVSEEQQQVEQPSGGERPGDKINASRNEDDDRWACLHLKWRPHYNSTSDIYNVT